MSTPTFECDFCPEGKVDILKGQGRQELVYNKNAVLNKKVEGLATRLKYRCQHCIDNNITVTPKDLMVYNAKIAKKAEEVITC